MAASRLGEAVVYVQSAVGVSMIAFGGFSWALDGAAAPVAAVLRLEPAMRPAGALRSGDRPADGMPAREIRFRDVTFAYPGRRAAPGAGALRSHHSRRLVAGHRGPERRRQDHHRQAAVPPVRSAVGRHRDRRRRPARVRSRRRGARASRPSFRTSSASSCRCATTWRPAGAPDEVVRAALESAGAANLAALDTVLARGYTGGTDLSGGQWQRVALARALAAVTLGAGVVLLDEPTAQLDVRGEAEIFDRLLAATRHCTTILISHRFSTVRHADRICVLEHGRVVELGTHDELMALGGRYRTMFDLQAQRFHRSRTRRARPMSPLLSAEPGIEPLPPALSSMWRLCKLGYRHEPRLMLAAFVLSQLAALPDALLALWLMLLGKGVLEHRPGVDRKARRSAWAYPPPPPGFCAPSARACSGASATR